MIGRGLLLLTTLVSCVLSLPVTSSQLENEDVKVMKCIVEVLTDVLSRPHVMPVGQECLVTLKTDDRLIKILRRHKFLKELQEIAAQGDRGRAQPLRDAGVPTGVTRTPRPADVMADRSMLEALGSPGERAILSQEKRAGNGDDRSEGGEPREDDGAGEDDEAGDKNPGGHASESAEKWSKSKAEDREEEEASDEKRAYSDDSEEERFMRDEPGGESEEKRAARGNKKEKKSHEEGEDEEDIRSALLSHKGEQEVERESRRSMKARRVGAPSQKRKEAQQEVPHHSKEVVEEDQGEEKRDALRSPEEKELQMIARRTPEERRASEEEGSASRKSEEIESLAAIESELENVAQKLHDLRRG